MNKTDLLSQNVFQRLSHHALSTYILTALLTVSIGSYAQKTAKSEDDHVRVTLTDGKVIEGYVRTYWVDGKLFKKMNTSFTLSTTPDGDNAVTYNAENVSSIDFVRRTSPDGKYDHLESHTVANPSTFSPRRTRRQFVYVEGENSVGKMYWWNGVDSQNMQLGKMNISTIYGICLKGDSVIVPFMTGNVISLNAMRIRYKNTNRKLVDYADKRILKGGKRLWEKIAYEPMLFLDICEEYINNKAAETDAEDSKK